MELRLLFCRITHVFKRSCIPLAQQGSRCTFSLWHQRHSRLGHLPHSKSKTGERTRIKTFICPVRNLFLTTDQLNCLDESTTFSTCSVDYLIFEMSHFECLRSHVLCNHLFLAVYVQTLFSLQLHYGTKRIILHNVWRL